MESNHRPKLLIFITIMFHKSIPLHDFTKDDETSVAFRYLPLELKDDHDASVPHRHNYYEIFIFMEGGGVHEIDFETYPIESYSIQFVSPGQVHQVKRTASSFGQVIFFSRDFFMVAPQQEELLSNLPFINRNDAKPVLQLSATDMEDIMPILQAMDKESKSQEPFYEEAVRHYLSLLLLTCRRRASSASVEATTIEGKLCQDFKALLEKHFRMEHQVKAYAQMLTTTPKGLNQALTNYTGITASAHIFNRIILEAKRLLRHSTLSIKEIAFFLNYEDPAHFSKFFKGQTGSSPAEFREG